MAHLVWLGATSTAFGTNTNWSTGSVPTNGDDVTVDGRALNNIAGSDQSAITLASLRIYRSCTKDIGTVDTTTGIVTPLKIGATICEIGLDPEAGGTSTGPQTVALDFAGIQTTTTLYTNRGTGAAGFSSCLLRGTHSSNKLIVKGGSVGIGTMLPSEATKFAQIDVDGSNSVVTIGYGVTLTTLDQRDGKILLGCAVTTINQDGGTLETRGAGAITTANIAGTFTSNSTGTITDLNGYGAGILDFSSSPTARTVTNCNIYGGLCYLNADNNVTLSITFTNGVILKPGVKSSRVNFGDNLTLQQA